MSEPRESGEHSFVKEFCVPFLLGAQNQDGGWGFYPDSESRVESTCWALRALQTSSDHVSKDALRIASGCLLTAQLKDGSWPAAPEERSGSWVTSLACSVLASDGGCKEAVKAGVQWLCEDYPRDSAPLTRLLGRLLPSQRFAEMDDTLRGWGWTPRTSSWVEPTAFALQAMGDCPAECRPKKAAERRKLGVALLYDRMCPEGGWNCGNPMVYGVAGEPLVLPTAWALLALHDQPEHERKTKSLVWLERSYVTIAGPASLAAARIVLEAYGKTIPESPRKLEKMFDPRGFMRTTEVVAWTCLALSAKRAWFPPAERAE